MSRGKKRANKQRLTRHRTPLVTRAFLDQYMAQFKMYQMPILFEAYLEARKHQRWYRRAFRFVWGLPGRLYRRIRQRGPEVDVTPIPEEGVDVAA